jgi:hypothetical protein
MHYYILSSHFSEVEIVLLFEGEDFWRHGIICPGLSAVRAEPGCKPSPVHSSPTLF